MGKCKCTSVIKTSQQINAQIHHNISKHKSMHKLSDISIILIDYMQTVGHSEFAWLFLTNFSQPYPNLRNTERKFAINIFTSLVAEPINFRENEHENV
jgi:hypothetical protein